MMKRSIIISCAVTGSGNAQGIHPNLPITPSQIADAAIDAARAGAAIVHIHVRDPKTGAPSSDSALYREVVGRIRESGVDVLLNLTTGMGADYVPSEEDPSIGGPGTDFKRPDVRMHHVIELRPEICSLDVATMNFGEVAYINTPAHLRTMAAIAREHGVKPEIEVFELGHIRLATDLVGRGLIDDPPLFQLCLGIAWGAEPTLATIQLMQNMLPANAVWSAFGISRYQRPTIAMAALLGGNVRVGLEDNLYLEKGVFASNTQLVERAVNIIECLGENVATPREARELIGIGKIVAVA